MNTSSLKKYDRLPFRIIGKGNRHNSGKKWVLIPSGGFTKVILSTETVQITKTIKKEKVDEVLSNYFSLFTISDADINYLLHDVKATYDLEKGLLLLFNLKDWVHEEVSFVSKRTMLYVKKQDITEALSDIQNWGYEPVFSLGDVAGQKSELIYAKKVSTSEKYCVDDMMKKLLSKLNQLKNKKVKEKVLR